MMIKKLAFLCGITVISFNVAEAQEINLDWNLTSKTQGFTDINLQEYEGKVIFLNLWAEWCHPCVVEMPSIQRLYAEYMDRVEFVTVVTEYTEATEEYLKETGYCFPVYEAYPPQSYNANQVPTTWIINKEGNIAMRHIGNFEWDSRSIKDLLDSLLAR